MERKYCKMVVEKFNEDEIVSYLEGPGTLLRMFTLLLSYISVGNLSQSVVDGFLRSCSIFRRHFDCAKHLIELREHTVHHKTILAYGQFREDWETVVLMSCPKFQEEKPIDIRFPYVWFRCATSLRGELRENPHALSFSGKVYFVGGLFLDRGDVMSTVTVVEPNTGEVSQAPPLNTPRVSTALAASSNEIFACGGLGRREVGFMSSCERYVPGSASWHQMAPLNRACDGAAAAVFGEDEKPFIRGAHLLITGGWASRGILTDVAVVSLDVDDAKWIDLAPMHHARHKHGIALYVGRILVAGGRDYKGNCMDSVEMMTLPQIVGDVGQWTELAALGRRSCRVNLAVRNNRIFSFENLGNGKTQIEEFLDDKPSRNDAQVDRKSLQLLTWRVIGDCPDVLGDFEGAVVVQAN